MLVLWGNNEALTAKKICRLYKSIERSKYSNRAVSDSVTLNHYHSNVAGTKKLNTLIQQTIK